jgi:holo-[acyl-carrier protein] synthase
MILGIGIDLIRIPRIEAALERHGGRFARRVFSEEERQRAAGNPASYAKRFAAKEACAKALGVGIWRGVRWQEIEIVSLPSGQPTLRLSGGARKRLDAMTPQGMQAALHLSLTDEHPYAQAMVTISAA